jgi:RNA polymerase sigma-70 factor (ECF subfamily)
MKEHTARLLARLGERAELLAADPRLDLLLEGLFDRAEGRLPHRPIRRDAMVDRIADSLLASDERPDTEALVRLNAADLYLALALAEKDIRALEISESELLPAVRQAVGRIDPSKAFIDEVCLRVRERLFAGSATNPPAIAQYRGTGPLARWVRVIASRIALELKHLNGDAACEPEVAVGGVPAPADPELEAMWHACADEYSAVLAEAFAGLSRRDRNLLRQRYFDELNIDALGRMYRVSPETTSLWLKQIEERLASMARTTLMARLALGEAQRESLARLVALQLQPTLPRVLRGVAHEADDR